MMKRPLLTQLGIFLIVIMLALGFFGQYIFFQYPTKRTAVNHPKAPSMTAEARIMRIGTVILHGKLESIQSLGKYVQLKEQGKELLFETEEPEPVTITSSSSSSSESSTQNSRESAEE